jgi:hypothetical protein
MKYYFGADIFVNALLDTRDRDADYILVPDVRFIEEIQTFRDCDFPYYVIQIGESAHDSKMKDAIRLKKLLNNLDGIHYSIEPRGLDFLPYEIECIIKFVLGDDDGKVQE